MLQPMLINDVGARLPRPFCLCRGDPTGRPGSDLGRSVCLPKFEQRRKQRFATTCFAWFDKLTANGLYYTKFFDRMG